MTLEDLFTRQWVCKARVFETWKCTAETHQRTRASTHGSCGYRWQASFTEGDFETIKSLQLVDKS